MASSNLAPAPIRIEYPRGTFKRDAPTGGGTSPQALSQGIQDLLTASIYGRLPADQSMPLIEFGSIDETTCFRNAVLTTLLNLKPFLNFLYLVTNDHTENPSSLSMLRDIADVYWDTERSRDQRRSDILPLVNLWQDHLNTTTGAENQIVAGGQPPATWASIDGPDGQHDSFEFWQYVFDRAHDYELVGNPQQALVRLFKIQLIERWALGCTCDNKSRQPFDGSSTNLWCLSVTSDRDRTPLDQLLARRMYSEVHALRTCPTCNSQNMGYHTYEKFKHLPEVFLVGVVQQTVQRNGAMGLDHRANTNMPDMIDLSYLQNFQPEDSRGSQGDDDDNNRSLYQLQAVISYNTTTAGRSGHYNVYVRRPDNTWTRADEFSSSPVTDGQRSIQLGRFRPRMLAYVRIRQPRRELSVNQNTRAHDTVAQGSDVPSDAFQNATQVPSEPSPLLVDGQPGTITQPATTAQPASSGIDDAMINTSGWDKDRFLGEMRNRRMKIGNVSTETRLRSLWNSYCAANHDDRLRYLLKAELVDRATNLGLPLTTQSTVDTLVDALIAHRQSQASQAAQIILGTSTQTTTTDPNAHPNADTSADQAGSDAPATIQVGNTTGLAPPPSPTTAMPQTQDAYDQMRQDNARLQTEVHRLQSENARLNHLLAAANAARDHLASQLSAAGDTIAGLQASSTTGQRVQTSTVHSEVAGQAVQDQVDLGVTTIRRPGLMGQVQQQQEQQQQPQVVAAAPGLVRGPPAAVQTSIAGVKRILADDDGDGNEDQRASRRQRIGGPPAADQPNQGATGAGSSPLPNTSSPLPPFSPAPPSQPHRLQMQQQQQQQSSMQPNAFQTPYSSTATSPLAFDPAYSPPIHVPDPNFNPAPHPPRRPLMPLDPASVPVPADMLLTRDDHLQGGEDSDANANGFESEDDHDSLFNGSS